MIAFTARYSIHLAVFVDIKQFFDYVRRKHTALGILDTQDEPHIATAVSWELREHSVHTPLIAIVDGAEIDEERLYRSGFDGIIDKEAEEEHLGNVIGNFLQVKFSS
jgi:DNA-binding NarL/FixJ family response regulator